MPSWKEHMKFCMEHGISEDVCKFANKLVDFPEETIPKFLKDESIKMYLSKKLNLSFEEIEIIRKDTEIIWKIKTGKICENCSLRKCKFRNLKIKPKFYSFGADGYTNKVVVLNVQRDGKIRLFAFSRNKYENFRNKNKIITNKNNVYFEEFIEYRKNCLYFKNFNLKHAIYHERIHNYSTNNKQLELIKELARYFYGEEGVKAVELHLKLDEINHILRQLKQKIPAYLSRGLSGKTTDRERYGIVMPCSNFVRKYIFKKPQNILRSLKPSNIPRFRQNLLDLLQKTVKDFLEEYGIEYNGILRNKKIIEVIREYQDEFGMFPSFIESILDNKV